MGIFANMEEAHEREIAERDAQIASLTAENERLTGCLAKANANHEHFEREWYLRGDQIDNLTAENEQLREHLDGMLNIICENYYGKIREDDRAAIDAASAALQPKEGEG